MTTTLATLTDDAATLREKNAELRRLVLRLDARLDTLAGPAGLLRTIRVHPSNRADVLAAIVETEQVRLDTLEQL